LWPTKRYHFPVVCPGTCFEQEEKVAFSLWCPRALGFGQEENEVFSPCCLGALGLEQEEKAT
jgi:hypothetical protein